MGATFPVRFEQFRVPLRVSLILYAFAFAFPAHPQDTAAPAPTATTASPAAPAPPQESSGKTEVSIQDSGTTFRLRVNLVQVHVIVRDGKGNPVGDLKKEDFLLYDQGKLQSISTFALETNETRRAKSEAAAKTQMEAGAAEKGQVILPDRFVALAFDDSHLTMEDTVYVKVEVDKFIDSLPATDRVAIYTTSGHITHDFTSDKEALKKTVLSLVPSPRFDHSTTECPDVSHYEADQVENKQNSQVFQVIVRETLQCAFQGDPTQIQAATSLAQSATQRSLTEGDAESEFTYRYMEDVLRKLSGMPGERVMVLVSPGFLLTTNFSQMSALVDRANRSNTVINTIDGRGLYTPDLMGDISKQTSDTFQTVGPKSVYRVSAQTEQAYVLSDLAYGTGGTFFHNSNDLAAGLHQVGAAPEASYVLGFSPQNQKMDGQFHSLKVTLADKRKFTVQARRGYFAPRKVSDPNQQARDEIQEAVFSRDEIMDLPLQLQTQYFKSEGSGVRLSVVSRLELGTVHFRKSDGRNWDDLTLATVIFDDNGNYVTGNEKIVQLRLLDATYAKLLHSGFQVKSSFDVKPGKYMIRQVVRDSEGSQMAARNGAVDIPY
jgi:VWFA-related protein